MTSGPDIKFAVDWIRRYAAQCGSVSEAARRFAVRYESRMPAIAEELGSWPSSEPELRALVD